MISDDCFKLVTAFSETKAQMEFKLNFVRAANSAVHTEINDILHIIEYIDLPANKMSKLTKRLKELYKQRRVFKEDAIVFRNILENGKDALSEIISSETRVARYEAESIVSLNKLIGV
jgi:DNA repair ATPase RecN